MDSILGAGNQIWGYILVLGVYLSLFVVIRQIQPTVEPAFRRTYWVLFIGWVPGIFIGNYLFYLIGIMSFLPWLDNLMHSSIWIGLGLGFLYAATYKRSLWEQCVL